MKINKTILSALFATAALGFTASANAAFPAAENSCPTCHGIIINGIQAVGTGGRNCSQRSEAAWVVTVNDMIGKGCDTITDVQGIAKYLASIGTATTTTTKATTTTTAATTTTTAATTTTTAATTTTTTAADTGSTTTAADTTTTVQVTTTTTATPTTVATTTTTTMAGCNTYVNGTTQYPYSGKGSCHGHGEDLTTFGHIVRDQTWCQKHKSHENSRGNHTHAYPHPTCM